MNRVNQLINLSILVLILIGTKANATQNLYVSVNTYQPISCSSASDGSFDILVTGGSSPYSYLWSNGATTQGLNNVAQGIYLVTVTDNTGCQIVSKVGMNTYNVQGTLEWEVSLGGNSTDVAESIAATNDGGFIIAGYTHSTDGDITGHNGGLTDAWIVKIDALGNKEWQTAFGFWKKDQAHSIKQTMDGGYIVAGISENLAPSPIKDKQLVLKLSSTGTVEWYLEIGIGNYNKLFDIVQAKDGSFIGTGLETYSQPPFDDKLAVLKVDQNGNYQWISYYGGTSDDNGKSIAATMDGGFIAAGSTRSNNGDVSGNNGWYDFWVVKRGPVGGISWQKTYGGSDRDEAESIIQTKDGGFVVAGYTNSNDGDVTGNNGQYDFWVIKIDPYGTLIWEKTLGGLNDDRAFDVKQTPDGGFLVAGETSSYAGDVTNQHGGSDYWVVKLDGKGQLVWQKTYGGSSDDEARSIALLDNGDFAIAGNSKSIDGDVTPGYAGQNYWIVKSGYEGAIEVTTDSIQLANCYNPLSGSIEISLSGGNPPYTYLWSNGATSEDINGIASGDYTITITDNSGCNAIRTITVKGVPVVTVDSTTMACTGNASTFISVSNGALPYSYYWSNGATTQNISGLLSGSYSLTVTDAIGCTATTGVQFSQGSPLYVSHSANDISCYGENDGAITASPTGGILPYSYEWSIGTTTMNLSNLSAGIYDCTITDFCGVEVYLSSIIIKEPQLLNSSAVTIHESLPGSNDGLIDLTILGGTPSYSYSWDNGATTEDISGLAPGDYCVTISDLNNCVTDGCYSINPGTSHVPIDPVLKTIDLYPNPANSNVILEVGFSNPVDVHIQIMSVLGTVILERKEVVRGSSQFEFDLTDFTAGTYFVCLKTNDFQMVKKMVVAN